MMTLIRRISFLAIPAALLLLAGCTSDKESPPPKKAVTKVPAEKQPVDQPKPKVEKPDYGKIWAEKIEQAEAHLAADEFEQVDQLIAELPGVYVEPEIPSEDEQEQLTALADALANRRAELVNLQREARLAEAKELMDVGKLADAIKALNAVRALSPTVAQTASAKQMEDEIERRRGARRRLQTWMQLLASEDRSQVRTAQSQLRQDPDTAIGMLVEAIGQADKPRLVANALETLRRLNRPQVVLPAMVGVLEREEQKENWPDAIRQIVAAKAPGAGEALLSLAVSSEIPEQRAIALDGLRNVGDPPPGTAVALLPLVFTDGADLPAALQATLRAVQIHRQTDIIARRSLDVEIDEQTQELLAKLPDRLAAIIKAGDSSDTAGEAAYAAQVLSVALGQEESSPLEGVKIHNVSAEAEDGPATALLDGVWNSVELATMWRYAANQRGAIVLDLGEERTVTGVRIWNFNETSGTQRGWKEVDVYVSNDPRELNPIASGVVPQSPGVAETPDYSTIIPVPYGRGRYVKIQAKTLWATEAYTGLAEVQVIGF